MARFMMSNSYKHQIENVQASMAGDSMLITSDARIYDSLLQLVVESLVLGLFKPSLLVANTSCTLNERYYSITLFSLFVCLFAPLFVLLFIFFLLRLLVD
jgi:hypothetical protein